jgi:hypothetical protein
LKLLIELLDPPNLISALFSSENELKALFKALGLKSEDLVLAVSVLGIDAQKGFYGEMGNAKILKVILKQWY